MLHAPSQPWINIHERTWRVSNLSLLIEPLLVQAMASFTSMEARRKFPWPIDSRHGIFQWTRWTRYWQRVDVGPAEPRQPTAGSSRRASARRGRALEPQKTQRNTEEQGQTSCKQGQTRIQDSWMWKDDLRGFECGLARAMKHQLCQLCERPVKGLWKACERWLQRCFRGLHGLSTEMRWGLHAAEQAADQIRSELREAKRGVLKGWRDRTRNSDKWCISCDEFINFLKFGKASDGLCALDCAFLSYLWPAAFDGICPHSLRCQPGRCTSEDCHRGQLCNSERRTCFFPKLGSWWGCKERPSWKSV